MTSENAQFSDLNADANLKRIDELESFKKQYEGKEFDKKVLLSIQESSTIQKEIKSHAWQTIREKIVWILLGALSLVLIDILKEVIPRLLK